MKKKHRYLLSVIFIIFLVFIDQISKVFIKMQTIGNVNNPSSNLIHIHPQLNTEGIQSSNLIANYLQLDVTTVLLFRALIYIIIFVIIIFFWIAIHNFFFWGCKKKPYMFLNLAIVSFEGAAILCSFLMDELFFGGSLDWICISWLKKEFISNHYHLTSCHFTFDIKDIYVLVAIILFVVRLYLFIYTCLTSTPDERKKYSYRGNHPIKNIREMITYFKSEGNLDEE